MVLIFVNLKMLILLIYIIIIYKLKTILYITLYIQGCLLQQQADWY